MKLRNTVISLCLLTLILTSQETMAQQKPIFTQYMFNGLAINPAYAGTQKILNATAVYRKQWVNIEGSPNTQTFSIHSPLKKRKHIGLGGLIMRDQINIHNQINAFLVYSYKIQLDNRSILSLGLQGGFSYLNSDYTKMNLFVQNDPQFTGSPATFNPNFGAGIYYYKTNRAYAGFSIPYLVKNKVFDSEDNASRLSTESRYYLLTGGIVFNLSDDLKLKPSGLLRFEEGAPLGMDINANLIIKELIFVGASMRSSIKTNKISLKSTESVSFLAQLQMTENWQAGYSYDLPISGLTKYGSGSHEIMLNYRINLTKERCKTYF